MTHELPDDMEPSKPDDPRGNHSSGSDSTESDAVKSAAGAADESAQDATKDATKDATQTNETQADATQTRDEPVRVTLEDDDEHDDQHGGACDDGVVVHDVDLMSLESLRDALSKTEAALASKQEEVGVLKDQALRATAEAENVRRRADRSIENARKFALEEFVADLLPAIDSFDRAVATAREMDNDDASVDATVEGIELSLKVLMDMLKRRGIETIDPEGEPFDPQFHEAMSMVPNPDAEPGSVLHVVEKGYTLHDRLVRAARVIVAKAEDDGAGAS